MPGEHPPIQQQKAGLRGKTPADFKECAKGGESENIWKVLSLSPLHS